MKPDIRFRGQDRSFWAHVRLFSESVGYSRRGTDELKRYNVDDLIMALSARKLLTRHIADKKLEPTEYGELLLEYLNYRSEILEKNVKNYLMDREQAKGIFEGLLRDTKPTCPLPMNKQKGEKRHYAYLSCIVNILTEKTLGACDFDCEPRGLTVITKDRRPLRTFSRWMDGAYPSKINPIAIWEVKEYYGITTFGSRVADGCYETMLDGEEILELYSSEKRKVHHYLIADDYFTWWTCGRSYLCRIVDMLNMGLVDEVLFGREVITKWPDIVKEWLKRRRGYQVKSSLS